MARRRRISRLRRPRVDGESRKDVVLLEYNFTILVGERYL